MTANRHYTFEILSEGYQREIAERMDRKPNLFSLLPYDYFIVVVVC